jgi:hypothetical protein
MRSDAPTGRFVFAGTGSLGATQLFATQAAGTSSTVSAHTKLSQVSPILEGCSFPNSYR